MPEIKFTQLPVATTPLVGNEIMALAQGGVSKQTTIDEISSTLQEAYTIGNGIIDLISGKPFKLTSTVAGQVAPRMTQAQFDLIASPDNGLFAWNEDTNRFRVNDGTSVAPTYEDVAYVSDVNLVDLQKAYDNGVGGNINLVVGSPLSLSSSVAGFLMPRMTQAQFDNIPSPGLGLISYATDLDRFRVNINTGSPVYENLSYVSDLDSLDLQTVYDNGVDGNIDLSVGKPFELNSLVAGFLMPRMIQTQFDGISNPDTGLLSYITDDSRFRVNIGIPASPVYEEIAYITDIPVFQQINFGEMYFNGNATETVIALQGTPVKIGSAAYSSGNLSGFSQSAGALTYLGIGSAEVKITVSLSATMSLDTDTMAVYIYVNGAQVSKSKQSTFLGPVSPGLQAISLQALTILSSSDFVEVFVANESDTDNIIIQEFNCIVQEIIVGLGDVSSIDLQSAYNNGDGKIIEAIGKPVSIESNLKTITPTLDFQLNDTPDFGGVVSSINFYYEDFASSLVKNSSIDVQNVSLFPPDTSGDRMRFFCGKNGVSEEFFALRADSNQAVFSKPLYVDSFFGTSGSASINQFGSATGTATIKIPGSFLNGPNNGAIRFDYDNFVDGVSFGVFPKVGDAGINFTRAVVTTATSSYPFGVYQPIWFTSIGNQPYAGSVEVLSAASAGYESLPFGHTIEVSIVGQFVAVSPSIGGGQVANFRWTFGNISGNVFQYVSRDITSQSTASTRRPFTLNLKMTRIFGNNLYVSASGYYVSNADNMIPISWNIQDDFVPYDPEQNFEILVEFQRSITATRFDFVCNNTSITQYAAFDAA